MKLASIDVGTNSVKLLVADVENQQISNILAERVEITRLGKGVDKTGELLQEAMDGTLRVIEDFKRDAESLEAREIIAVATSAMREARNRDAFIQKVMDRTGIKLQVISGDEEAELSFAGVCSDPLLRSKRLIIADVGGGSSEFIVGQDGKIDNRFSINTGCVRLTEEFLHSDPIDPTELQMALQNIISSLYSRLIEIPMDDRYLVGVGGTITALAAIHQNMLAPASSAIHRYVLLRDEIIRLLTYLRRMTLEDRKKVPGLPPERADIIVAGAAVFSAILDILRVKEITVSARGLRYGVLLRHLRHSSFLEKSFQALEKA